MALTCCVLCINMFKIEKKRFKIPTSNVFSLFGKLPTLYIKTEVYNKNFFCKSENCIYNSCTSDWKFLNFRHYLFHLNELLYTATELFSELQDKCLSKNEKIKLFKIYYGKKFNKFINIFVKTADSYCIYIFKHEVLKSILLNSSYNSILLILLLKSRLLEQSVRKDTLCDDLFLNRL